MSLEAQLTIATKAYQKLQTDYAGAVEGRQRLDAQLSENESVMKEFAQLTPENKVYKLLGPVLLLQEQDEAKVNVSKRLEFIRSEIVRLETQLADLDTKLEAKKMEVVHLQTQIQQAQQTAQREAGAVAAAKAGARAVGVGA